MYLNLHSFNARCKHEDLWMYTIRLTFDDGESMDFMENRAKEMLQSIKEFNKDKNVVFTCAIPEDNSEDGIVYLETAWSFAYETLEYRQKLYELIEEKFNTYDAEYKLLTPIVCPFMNKGELI